MIAKGYRNGRLIRTSASANKTDARSTMLKWSDCDAFRYGRRFYSPSQVYAGMQFSTNHLALGIQNV